MKQTMQDYNDWSLENFIKILREKFRHRDFWKFQYEAITNILNHKSTLVVKTTGAGKSLIYQFASLIMQKGLTLVITPLLSLMLDQISNISPCLRAACINSLISIQKRKKIWELVKKGKVNVTFFLPSPTHLTVLQILFVTPECLQQSRFPKIKDLPPINFICIDEAHCITTLSHNFRPSYLKLMDLVNARFGRGKTLLALTGTATFATQKQIC